MNKKRVSVTAIIIILLWVTGFPPYIFGVNYAPTAVLAESDLIPEDWTNRTFHRASPEEVEETVSQMQYLPNEEPLPFEALEIATNAKTPWFIFKAGALEDVEQLFYLLEKGYAGYGYFADKGSFDEAKGNIINELDSKPIWTSDELSNLIHKHLSFLRDSHLSIGEKKYTQHMDFWFDRSIEVEKKKGEYSFTSDNVEYTVVSVNGENSGRYIFPSLNIDGDIIYRLGLLSDSKPEPLELIARSGQVSSSWNIELSSSQHQYSGIFEEKTVGGVPIIRIRSFSDHHKEYIDQFLESANRYKDEPCLIVDIRGNGGGNMAWPRGWITRLTGKQPVTLQIFTELVTETSMMGRSNYFVQALRDYQELEAQGYEAKADEFMGLAESIEDGEFDSHWSSYLVPRSQMIPNNMTLIVLIDSNVFSSGEGFISYLNQVENVVIVGENSGGALIYGQMTYHVLPNSKLSVYLPISLNVFADLVYREEVGFFPDLWVPAEDAVNYAVAAVRKGSIATSESYQEELSRVEFIPETPSYKETILGMFPVIFGLFYGMVLVYVNRARDEKIFLVGGIIGGLVGILYLSKNSIMGIVFILVGVEYLVIAVYKWRKKKKEIVPKRELPS
jgi:hypothetical protein